MEMRLALSHDKLESKIVPRWMSYVCTHTID